MTSPGLGEGGVIHNQLTLMRDEELDAHSVFHIRNRDLAASDIHIILSPRFFICHGDDVLNPPYP